MPACITNCTQRVTKNGKNGEDMKEARGVRDIRGLEQGLRDGHGQNTLFTYLKLLKN